VVRWLLNNIPSLPLFVAVTAAAIGIGVLAEVYGHRTTRRSRRHSNEMLGVAFDFVGIAYAILIGFVIVALWDSQVDVRETVDAEAGSLRGIAIVGGALPAEEARRIDEAVHAYGRSVVDTEWPALRHGRESPETEAAARALFTEIVAGERSDDLAGSVQEEMIGAFTEFYDLRIHRLAEANAHLAGELWVLVLLASLALIALVSGFQRERRWDLVATVAVAGTMGIVIFVVVSLSYPYSGDVSVSSEPFVNLVLR
jgi:hypothetical protein